MKELQEIADQLDGMPYAGLTRAELNIFTILKRLNLVKLDSTIDGKVIKSVNG